MEARAFLLLAIALFGVPVYALIATSLGVFGANPLAQDVQRKIRPSHAYLYLLLSSLYTYAIYATSLWQRGALLVLTLLLALALWQKARDRLPYLLDPDRRPAAARVAGRRHARRPAVLRPASGDRPVPGRQRGEGDRLRSGRSRSWWRARPPPSAPTWFTG